MTGKSKLWTERQVAYLKRHYADTPMDVMEAKLKRSQKAIWGKAAALGLRKSSEYWHNLGLKLCQDPKSKANRYAKGHEPQNKGKRIEEYMSADAIRRSAVTRFKVGHEPHNRRDIGTECQHADGYVYLKTDDGYVLKHRYVWEQANGPIPDGYVIKFVDGDRANCDLSNLKLISKQEMCRQRMLAEPEEHRKARQAKIRVSRNATIRRDRIRIHWGLEPRTRLVKKW